MKTTLGFEIDETRESVDPVQSERVKRAKAYADEHNVSFAEALDQVLDDEYFEGREAERIARQQAAKADADRRANVDGEKLRARAKAVAAEKGIDYSEALVDVFENEYADVSRTAAVSNAGAVPASALDTVYFRSLPKDVDEIGAIVCKGVRFERVAK